MAERNPKVEFFFSKDGQWQTAFQHLRNILLDTVLTEELKWGVPCYAYEGTNVVLIHGFKEYCALLFHKGVLLKDPNGILIQQTENVQSARQIRFTSVKQIDELESTIQDYVQEAIALEKSGAKVPLKETREFAMPAEFKERLIEHPALKDAFEALTPGRQRAYLLHFSSAKQSATRAARVEKCMPRILDGLGLDD